MKISLAQTQWFDNQGYPLVAGRVSVFLHESDTPATLYTLEGDQYVEAQNPFILDEGGRCPTGSIWFDATVVDVLVESYNGVPGSYSTVDRYEDGFEVPGVTNDTMVVGMTGLVNANPELGVVTVVGYDNERDCEARQFVWDPNCTMNEDGGAIVASTTSENGRWILLSDERYMPSSYYGIKAGSSEANISAFLTYPETVGQWSIQLPPVPRFKAGTYTSGGTMSTTKTVAFDTGAKFTSMNFNLYAAEIMYNSDYVADFFFAKQQLARSSWFRSVSKFWTCGARELYQERLNYFTSTAFNNNYGVAYQKISGTPLTMTGTGALMFTDCEFEDGCLSTGWRTTFNSCRFSDRWFADMAWDFGSVPAHHTQVNPATNYVAVANFQDANVYVLWAAAYNVQGINLEGRFVDTISESMPFTSILDGKISNAKFTHTVSLENCTVGSLALDSYGVTLSAIGCTLGIVEAKASQLSLQDCRVTMGADLDSIYTGFNMIGGSLGLGDGRSIVRSDATNHLNSHAVNMQGVIVNGGTIEGTGMVLRDCDFYDTIVRNIPGGVGDENQVLSVRVEDCNFGGSAYLALTPGIDDSSSMNVYEVAIGYLKITGNTFLTSVPGIRMPFWAQDGEHRFIAGVTTFTPGDSIGSGNPVDYFPLPYIYENNTGNCPRAFGRASGANAHSTLAVANGWSDNTGVFFMSDSPLNQVFALPAVINASREAIPDPTQNDAGVYGVDKRSLTVPYRAKAIVTFDGNTGGCCLDYPIHVYLPACAYDKSLPNDMFNCVVGSWSVYAQFCGVNPIAPGQ